MDKIINQCYMSSPIGNICIEENGTAITALYLVKELADESGKVNKYAKRKPDIIYKEEPSELLDKAQKELSQYFNGNRTEFDLPVYMSGTEFQISVWDELCRIPYGETRCYEDIAKSIKNPKACRAIGGANNKNHIIILVPCHRVIGKNGDLVGFGAGLEVKRYLLELERQKR